MKATLFLTLATMANAAPRIEQISPATGRIDGSPVAFDIDNDGDLDIAYLCNGQVGNGASASSAWLENLGDRKFSAPRALGHNFFTNNRSSIAETLIRPAHSDTSTLLHLTASISSQSIELHAKAVGSSSWKFIHRFGIDQSVSFLTIPKPGQQLLFSKHASSDSVTVWQAYPDAIIKKGQLTLPPAAGNGNNTPSNFQSVDLDQDGDADLVLESGDKTLVYEQFAPFQYSATPVTLDLQEASIGDLNLDGKLDLFDRSFHRKIAINEGSLTFSESTLTTSIHSSASSFLGRLGGLPTVIDLVAGSSDNPIRVNQLNPALTNFTEIHFETNSVNTMALLVADFDQDGQSDITFVSRSTAPFRTIFTGRSPHDFITPVDRVIIPGIPTTSSPGYDQVYVSWGRANSFSEPSPAAAEAPIRCDSPAIGDFNNDGFADLVVGPDINGQARLLINDGRGKFPTSRLLTGIQPAEFEAGGFDLQNYVPVDLNGDGNLDLSFTISRNNSSFHPFQAESACAVALGDGQGRFLPVTLPPGSFETIANGFCGILEFRDLDQDGDLDAILPGAWRENIGGTLRQSAYPLIQNAAASDALGNPINVASQLISDLDGDGFPDVLIPASKKIPIDPSQGPVVGGFFQSFSPGLAFNTGNGGIEDLSEFTANLLVTDALGNPLVLPYRALDLDLDGRREILTSDPAVDALGNPTVSRIHCLKLDSNSPRDLSLAETISYPVFSIPPTDELHDFNGDGELEYVSADQFITPTIRGPLISPKYNFKGDHLSNTYPSIPAIAVDDFDNDGDVDALYADGFSGLHLVRNTIIDEDSPITSLLIDQGLTPARATPHADPDHDGRNNALELLHGTDLLTPDSAPSNFLLITLSPDGKHLVYKERKNADELGLYYDFEISRDLVTWTRIPTAEPVIKSTESIWNHVSVEIPRTNSRTYHRISATHDPRR